MANPFVHIELNTTDVDKAKAFYGQLFDWKLEDMQMGPSGTYTTINVGDGTGGGLLKNPMPGVPSFWLAYVLVDDIGAATKKAAALGAKIVKDSIEVPTWAGSHHEDPTGRTDLWQNKLHEVVDSTALLRLTSEDRNSKGRNSRNAIHGHQK
jgi:predicted enzyme related to lactoylglutathione lyase